MIQSTPPAPPHPARMPTSAAYPVNTQPHGMSRCPSGTLSSSSSPLVSLPTPTLPNRLPVPSSALGMILREMAKLVQLGRLNIDFDNGEVTRTLSRSYIWLLDLTFVRASTRLDSICDPANELIDATSIIYDIPLLTRDSTILKSKVVPLAR